MIPINESSASERKDKAQSAPVKISTSVSFIMIEQRTGIADFTRLVSGRGLPRVKFEFAMCNVFTLNFLLEAEALYHFSLG